MRFFARPFFSRVIARRFTSGVLLAAYALTAVGVPLPLGRQAAKSGELFPCAMSKCGCQSAERCWRSCCCHSLAERLTWARRYGVRPPEHALAEARAAGLEIAWLDDSSDGMQASGNCCEANAAAGKSNCCQATLTSAAPRTDDRSCCEDHHDRSVDSPRCHSIVGWHALKCRGKSTNWLAAVPTLILNGVPSAEKPPLLSRLGPAVSDQAEGIADRPMIPPPEVA